MQLSSRTLNWPGLVIEKHIAPIGERPETTIDHFLLCLWQGQTAARCEHANSRGAFVFRVIQPGTMTLYSPGAVAAVHPFTASNFLLCALDRKFLYDVREEMKDEGSIRTCSTNPSIVEDQSSFNDPSLRRILLLLQEEARLGGLTGALYAEGLGQALAGRFLTLTHIRGRSRLPEAKLRSTTMRRLIERIEQTPPAQFDLQTLAAEAGYSKRHFLRAFHASTGFSPHQYILHLRLKRAKQLMARRSLSLLDIALESGFSSHAHFSHAFRQRFGVSPSDFRRAL
jgi:AraC family transcriptional regulator